MKLVLYIFLASLIESVNWCNKTFVMLIKGLSYLFNVITSILQKGQRPLFVLCIREQRKMSVKEKIKTGKKEVPAQSVQNKSGRPIVGGTKTIFIVELPVLNEPVPLETIELPLEEPEKPEELPFPDTDEFEQEIETISADELRREMEESIYGDYEDNLPDDDTSGVSIHEMEQAYKVLHDEIPTDKVSNDVVVNVLYTLNGTDMFKMLINSEESDKMAKSIMDSYIKKYKADDQLPEEGNFDIGNFLE